MVAIQSDMPNRRNRRHGIIEYHRWEVEVKDRERKELVKRVIIAHSFLIAYSRLLRGWWMQNQGTETVIDTSNTGRTMPQNQNTYTSATRFIGVNDGTAVGIQVGTGTAANSVTTYALQTQIADGSGVGQLVRGALSDVTPTIAGSVISWKMIRIFTNNSTGAVVVGELALYCSSQGNNSTVYTFCIARDVLSPTVSVPAGSTLTVRYVHSITVS